MNTLVLLLEIGKAPGATIEGIAKAGSKIIDAARSETHEVLDCAADLDEKAVRSFEDAASDIITSAAKDTTKVLVSHFMAVLEELVIQ